MKTITLALAVVDAVIMVVSAALVIAGDVQTAIYLMLLGILANTFINAVLRIRDLR